MGERELWNVVLKLDIFGGGGDPERKLKQTSEVLY